MQLALSIILHDLLVSLRVCGNMGHIIQYYIGHIIQYYNYWSYHSVLYGSYHSVLSLLYLYFCFIMQDGGSGFVAVRTDRYIIFGSYSSAMYPSVCVEAVESLGE